MGDERMFKKMFRAIKARFRKPILLIDSTKCNRCKRTMREVGILYNIYKMTERREKVCGKCLTDFDLWGEVNPIVRDISQRIACEVKP